MVHDHETSENESTSNGSAATHQYGLVKAKLEGSMKTMIATFFLSLISCCAFAQDKAAIADAEAGCGPDNIELSVTTDESKHPTPAPENGKALLSESAIEEPFSSPPFAH
jgi:hypothetical protein